MVILAYKANLRSHAMIVGKFTGSQMKGNTRVNMFFLIIRPIEISLFCTIDCLPFIRRSLNTQPKCIAVT